MRACGSSNGVSRELEVAVIPLGDARQRATAVLLLRSREIQLDPEDDERKLFAEAEKIRERVVQRLGS